LNQIGGTKCLGVHISSSDLDLATDPLKKLVVFKDVLVATAPKEKNKHNPHLLDRLKTTLYDIF